MATHLIGIMGKKRSGKDTLAGLLVANHGYTRISLADPLREMALGLDPVVGMTLEETFLPARTVRLSEVVATHGWEGVKATRFGPEVRRTLQRLGTEAVRNTFGPDTWAKEMLRRADAVDGPVVVPDVRFPEEYRAVNWYAAAPSVLVRVVGRGVVGDTHPSETALDDWPAGVILDNGPGTTLDDLAVHAATLARP